MQRAAAARVLRDSLRLLPPAEAMLPAGIATRLREWFAQPVRALPLDRFRVLIALLSFVYFARTLAEAGDFSNPDGLIDHDLSAAIFPFTRLGLFQPGTPLVVLQAAFIIACLASIAVAAGYRVKLLAALLYVIAVSTYRWNFMVMFVDDGLMHIMLLWLLLLPVGKTLVLHEWRDRARWKTVMVPGTAVRCFLWNVILIYTVAGLWKWTSPMWRDGTALYAVLKLPISRAPDFWRPEHLPYLKVLTWAALLLETAVPVALFIPKGHRARTAMLVALLLFHAAMIATLRIPIANLACMAAMVIVFRPRDDEGGTPVFQQVPRAGIAGGIAIALVSLLTLMMLSFAGLPEWRMPVRNNARVVHEARDGVTPLQLTFIVPLWLGGVAQQYQLFNWIDERNFALHHDAVSEDAVSADAVSAQPVDAEEIFPRSTRAVLLQLYLHGVTWMQIPTDRQAQLRDAITYRSARRYCRGVAGTREVAVYGTLQRIRPGVELPPERSLVMRFQCRGGEALMR
jgi:hypothetical protein